MSHYEYKVIPAPTRAAKARAVKGTAARFAHTLGDAINQLAKDGWEYQRAESLPCEERTGLRGKTAHTQHVLVFRRQLQPVPVWADTMVEDQVDSAPETPPLQLDQTAAVDKDPG